MPRDNGRDGAALSGYLFIGPFLGFEFGDAPSDGRVPLLRVKVEGRRPDGEPYWFRGWAQPALLEQLRSLEVGEVVVAGFSPNAKSNARGAYMSSRVDSVTPFTDVLSAMGYRLGSELAV